MTLSRPHVGWLLPLAVWSLVLLALGLIAEDAWHEWRHPVQAEAEAQRVARAWATEHYYVHFSNYAVFLAACQRPGGPGCAWAPLP